MSIANLITTYLSAILFLLITHKATSQECVSIPTGTWDAETINGSHGKYGSSQVSISIQDSSYVISDFTGGLFGEFSGEGVELTFSINCNGTLIGDEFDTDYGRCEITGGYYDSLNQELKIDWVIPFNQLEETTVFTK
ncbi:MAG: hypothetical protein RLN88_00260 [Ekhidna sp.]|uniref:hypothetical protein n=1 Tax=Ekhidna sp. TaxID=2608089 RepID=UPI0032EA9275